MTVGEINGVTNGTTNFGTLTTVAGAVTQVAFTTQPNSTVYGSYLNPQPVVKTQDQFGNDSVNGLGVSDSVKLTLSGTGSLQGTTTSDIGTNAGNGVVLFSDLTVDKVGTGNYLTAITTDFAGDDSNSFNITAKPITVTVASQTKVYGDDDPTSFNYSYSPASESGDSITGTLSRVAGEEIGTYEILQGDLTAGSNYTIDYTQGHLTITDNTAPVTTDNIPSGWQNSDVIVTLNCNDAVGGNSSCSKVYYTTDGNDPITSSDSVNNASSWQFTVKYRAEDVLGNLEEVKTAANTLQLDKTVPVIIDLTPPQGSDYVTSNTEPTISTNYSDNGSGINTDSVILKVDDEEISGGFYKKTSESISYTPFDELAYGYHKVYAEVEDILGNKAKVEWTFGIADIDEVAPTATQSPVSDSTKVALDTHPTITFSEAMKKDTLTTSNIKLRKCNGTIDDCTGDNVTDVEIEIVVNETTVTIIPTDGLLNETHYYFFIGAGVEDSSANSLSLT